MDAPDFSRNSFEIGARGAVASLELALQSITAPPSTIFILSHIYKRDAQSDLLYHASPLKSNMGIKIPNPGYIRRVLRKAFCV